MIREWNIIKSSIQFMENLKMHLITSQIFLNATSGRGRAPSLLEAAPSPQGIGTVVGAEGMHLGLARQDTR